MAAREKPLSSSLRALLCVGVLGLPSIVAGCSYDDPVFPRPRLTMLEIDYDAADVLAHQARGMLPAGTPVRVDVLKNAYAPPPGTAQTTVTTTTTPTSRETVIERTPLPDESEPAIVARPDRPMTTANEVSPFGKVILQQVAGRWVQLGFDVVGGFGRPRRGEAVLTGQYARTGGHVLVNLRLVEAGSGRILAAYDYTIPATGEVTDLLRNDGSVGIMGSGVNLY